MWTAVAVGSVTVGGVSVNRAHWGRFMGNTVRKTTSPVHMSEDFCVEVRGTNVV